MPWPATLPRPRLAGYQIAPGDQTVRTDMEVGAARVRRRSTARDDRITLEWLFTDAQLAEFRAWFDTEAAGGAAWFTGLAVFLGDASATETRFAQSWTAEAVGGGRWRVAAQIEAR